MTKPSELDQVQADLGRLLVAHRSVSNSPDLSVLAEAFIAPGLRLSAIEQAEIYREQFWLRHTSALLDDFPGLARLLGQAAWERLVEGYLAEYPPTAPTLRDLGQRLPTYVASLPLLERRPLLTDMARLEWAYLEVFDAADVPSLDLERLSHLSEDDWASAHVILAPSLRLLRLEHSVAELRRTLLQDQDAGSLTEPASTHLVVYRSADGSLWDKALSPVAFELLQAFADGTPFLAATEHAAKTHPDAENQLEEGLFGWFSAWGRLGWVCDVTAG